MQEPEELFSRRRFMQWSAAGVAAVGARGLGAQQNEPELAGERQPPEKPVVLHSAELRVVLDPESGLPFEYVLHANGARLRGEDFGQPITATLCRRDPWTFADAIVMAESHSGEAGHVVFRYAARFGGTPAARFALRYALHGATVVVSMEDVAEEPGFELIDVKMPRLVTVRESDAGAWLAHGEQGGSVAMLAEARAGSLPLNSFWGNVLSTLPVVMVGTAQAMCVAETTAFMDGTLLTVTPSADAAGAAGGKRASLGTDKVHRVDGSACYDLNLGRGVPRNCGTASTPNLLVEQASSCRLDFLPVSGVPQKAWIAAGRLVRERMPKLPTDFYNDKYVYGIRCDEPRFPQPSATFAQCAEIVGRVAALTDGAPQVVHLWGWQFRGKDTGYPAVNVVNERIGGYDGMMRLMDAGPALDATITLSDNYDDAYRSSPEWDEEIVARRPDGELWKSREWTGEESYILGLAKYMEGAGRERVRYTCERYKLKKTTHVDVLSYYAIRNDWDHGRPASGIRNLREGRYKVLEAFKAHGVDVSSEALRYPMIGHISCFWYLTGPAPCPFGGSAIPLVPQIYGASAVWGLSGAGARGDAATVRILQRFYGASPHSTLRADTDVAEFTDAFYLGMVPFFALRGRAVTDFEREGDRTRVQLEGGAAIESDLVAKTIRIWLGGVEVLRDDAVFCPVFEPDDEARRAPAKIACYSITPRTVEVPLPAGWDPARVKGTVLSTERREPATLERRGRAVAVALEARRPVMLYRDAASAAAAGSAARG